MTSNNTLEQTIVRRAAQLATTDEPAKVVKTKSGEEWQEYLSSQMELSDPMKTVVFRQGRSQNCAKPIGLCLGRAELVAKQDTETAKASPKTKLNSFIESLRWHAEEMDTRPPISSEVAIPGAAKLIIHSELQTPGETWNEVVDYVEQVYRQRSLTCSQ